jgi:uncharacterized lipoprotein YehR (DUF1307 family)
MRMCSRWVRVALSLLLVLGVTGCSKEAMKRHGIEVEGGKIKKRVFEF